MKVKLTVRKGNELKGQVMELESLVAYNSKKDKFTLYPDEFVLVPDKKETPRKEKNEAKGREA